jgi:3-methyladenine DNA glycosylase AlkD
MAYSEVRRLLSQIESEYESAQQGLHGIATTASHQFITARMERIAECYALLVKQVGEQAAASLVAQQDACSTDP